MSARAKVIKVIPFNASEVYFMNRISKILSYKPQSIPNNRGGFSSIRIISSKNFRRDDIGLIINKFKEKYDKHISFKKANENDMVFVGYLTITENV